MACFKEAYEAAKSAEADKCKHWNTLSTCTYNATKTNATSSSLIRLLSLGFISLMIWEDWFKY